jgi:hypothetical protein
MAGELKIANAELVDDLEKAMTLRIWLQNPSARTMHAYATLRAVRYDASTKTLEVQLSDRGLQEMGPAGSFVLPRFTPVDAQGQATIEVPLPRTIARLKPGKNMIAPIVEELPAHEAERVEVEVAYSGTPFYRDPRPKTGNTPRKMMVDWAEGHAQFTLLRSATSPTPKP